MATLHQATEITKKILIGFGIGIASILFIAITIKGLVNLKNYFFPTPPTPPTVSFGKLPKTPFPVSTITTGFTYTLSTATGTLPIFSDRVTVYKIAQPQPNLLNFDTANTLLAKNGFSVTPTPLSDAVFQWKTLTPPAASVTYNIVTSDFSLTSNYLTDPAVLAASGIPDQPTATDFAQSFFTNFLSFPTDIDSTKTQTSLLAIKNGLLSSATSLSDTQVIRVDFYQKDINTMPIVYPHFPHALIYALIASGQAQGQPQVVEAAYNHKTILTDQNATYPIKPVQQAFEELKTNNAYIANYDSTNTNVTIRSVSLGYFVGENPQQYAMPVIIFQGDNNFYAYVTAIADGWVDNQ